MFRAAPIQQHPRSSRILRSFFAGKGSLAIMAQILLIYSRRLLIGPCPLQLFCENCLETSCSVRMPAMATTPGRPEQIMRSRQEEKECDPLSGSITERCGTLSVTRDRYIEHLIITDKVVTAVLRDISGGRPTRISERGKLRTRAKQGCSSCSDLMRG